MVQTLIQTSAIRTSQQASISYHSGQTHFFFHYLHLTLAFTAPGAAFVSTRAATNSVAHSAGCPCGSCASTHAANCLCGSCVRSHTVSFTQFTNTLLLLYNKLTDTFFSLITGWMRMPCMWDEDRSSHVHRRRGGGTR